MQTSEHHHPHCTAWPLYLELDLPHVAKHLPKPPPCSLIFSQVLLYTLPHQTSVSHLISQLLIRFILQRIWLERGCLQDRALQNLSSREISAWGTSTLAMHQHVARTFSSGHPQERNKERTSIQPASQSFCIHPVCVKSKFDWKAELQN